MDTREDRPFRVLLATDASESARNAETWVSQARWPEPCVVDVLCVASYNISRQGWPMLTDRSAVSQAMERLRESEVMAAERIANEVGLRLQRTGMTMRTLTRQAEAWLHQGTVAAEILATIDLDPPDIVVIGPRGRSTLVELLLGSVTRRVVAESRSPVLVARPTRPAEGGGLPRRMLVLVDGTRATEAAVECLVSSGWATGAQVTLLALLGFAPGVEFDDPELVSQVNEALRGDAAETLAALEDRLADQAAEIHAMLDFGHPHETALGTAARLEPDVIVVARPSGSRAKDPFAENIARYAPVSTLVVPET